MEHLTLWGLCGLLMISTRFSMENQVLEVGRYFLLFDQIWGPTVRISTKNSSEKSNAPQTDRQIDRQTDRQTDRQADRQTDMFIWSLIQ